MKFLALILAAFLIISPAHATKPAGQSVTYFDGETELEGYWAPAQCMLPEIQSQPAPIVLIVHQWKGFGEYEKSRANMLSLQCYNAFAIDMYGKGIRPQTPEDAGKEATKYKSDPALARRRMAAALDFARQQPNVDPSRIASIGYCFGGTMSLELARSGADIDGVVSFHGGLSTPAPVTAPGTIKADIQVHHGAADPLVPQTEVTTFMNEMDTADADWELTQYADAVHSFTEKAAGDDPSKGVAYNEKADKRSWESTLNFLKETLTGK